MKWRPKCMKTSDGQWAVLDADRKHGDQILEIFRWKWRAILVCMFYYKRWMSRGTFREAVKEWMKSMIPGGIRGSVCEYGAVETRFPISVAVQEKLMNAIGIGEALLGFDEHRGYLLDAYWFEDELGEKVGEWDKFLDTPVISFADLYSLRLAEGKA